MRKLLLGTTAVAASALFAPHDALAQAADPFLPAGPPMMSQRALEVRVGGYFRFNYSFTDQDRANANGRPGPVAAGAPAGPLQTANIGKSDFSSDAEIHITANGKAANGLRYGVAIELQVDINDGSFSPVQGSGRNSSNKTNINTDEMWMFVAGDFGQIRFGDKDGILNLIQSGHVANFGTGGADGDYYDQQIGFGRVGTSYTVDLGDSTKVTYLSPQFFGFDFGASFAFNTGEGEDTGCILDYASAACDRANGYSGAPRRRNETQLGVRWRGSFGGVGLSATGGIVLADPTKVTAASSTGAVTAQSAMPIRTGYAGVSATAFGFLIGGEYYWGQSNTTYTPLQRGGLNNGTAIPDTHRMSQFFAGVSYTLDALTVGANWSDSTTAGVQTINAARHQYAWSVGATYRVAPGLELVAEYVKAGVRERGYDLVNATRGGGNNSITTDQVLVGTRIAF
ncbi:porin [Roseomonas sp. BN140053]|uniref:porin n=1 Tax=Roseomonas sp. BN140053 TaxID=3391898 RepID=UPI0039EA8B6C